MTNAQPKKQLPKKVPLARASIAATALATEPDDVIARRMSLVLEPEAIATMTLEDLHGFKDPQYRKHLLRQIKQKVADVNAGKVDILEAMLVSQSLTLDALFQSMVRKAINSQGIEHFDTYFKLGLRAQSQCRANIEAITLLKNPPQIAFVRQANIAAGVQQINNMPGRSADTRGTKSRKPQSKLLEASDGKRMDARTAGKTGKADQYMETVGTLHWAADGRGKKAGGR